MSVFYWKKTNFPAELNTYLAVAAEYRPEMISADPCGKELKFKRAAKNILRTKISRTNVLIEAKTTAGFARGLGCLFAGLEVDETTDFESLGIMIDCSRNKVFKLEYLKEYLFKMSLMGGNLAMLYTEDTYQLPGEPYFGYMRGAYSLEELQEADAFAKRLGIELVGCIQTLGHMAEILQYEAYYDIKDTDRVMLVDEPKTYQLIGKMLAFWKKALSTRRIHIGMDETHDLGRGQYADRHGGAEKRTDIFNRHLKKVNELCKKYGMSPIIWSDMYFRLGSKTMDYYDVNAKIPASVKAGIPKNVQLCYWDYYHRDQAFYEDYIRKHRDLAGEPMLASGVWTWSKFWCDMGYTEGTVIPCINACRKLKLKELFFTMWGDDGGYCIYDSSLMGLELACSLAWGESPDAKELLEKRFFALTGESYDLFRSCSVINMQFKTKTDYHIINAEKIIWEDPLVGVWQTTLDFAKKGCMAEYLKALKKQAERLAKEKELSLPLRTVQSLTEILIQRIELRNALLTAYRKNDRPALRRIAVQQVPALIDAYNICNVLMRTDWMNCAKPFGFEAVQRRLAGVAARIGEIQTRILEYIDGDISRIDELDSQLAIIPVIEKTGMVPRNRFSGSVIY